MAYNPAIPINAEKSLATNVEYPKILKTTFIIKKYNGGCGSEINKASYTSMKESFGLASFKV